jgi:quercetin dioxygenase-like cupin family protein
MSVSLLSFAALFTAASAKSIWLDTTPQAPQPYALKKGHGIPLGQAGAWNWFPVTGNSSGNAFCIMNTAGAGTAKGQGVFPHVHKKTYENFYSFKGRVQLWGQNLDTYKANTSVQQTRVLAAGDFGAIPHNTIHTFNLVDPDTLLTGVLVPGGFEELFFAIDKSGFNFDLTAYDVYPQTDFVPRTDDVNGRAGPGNWYDGPNPLPADSKAPIWVAKDHGPKWLNSDGGRYQIISPFVTGNLTDNAFAQGTITMSPQLKNGTAGPVPVVHSPYATAFQMEEGQLAVDVQGYDQATLIEGDVIFVPANTSFSYFAQAEFTKFMYVSGGGSGLDAMLQANAKTWTSAFYPTANGPLTKRTSPMVKI